MENVIFAILALIILPIGYLSLCAVMQKQAVKNPPFFSFFLAFGTCGGICVAGTVGIPLCLLCGAPILLSSMLSLFAAIKLGFQKEKEWFHQIAIGTCYITSIPFVLVFCTMIFGLLAGFHDNAT